MQFGKLLLVAAAAILSLADLAEAGRKHKSRHRGWKRLVHRRCVNDNEVAIAVGGPVDSKMIRTVKRTLKKYKRIKLTLVVNPRDFTKPHNRKHKRRNVKFIKSVAKKVSFAILPWNTKKNLRRMKLRKLAALYRRSARVFAKALGSRPLVAHMPNALLTKRRIKYMARKGFTILGKTTRFENSKRDLRKDSFIALQQPRVHQFSRLIRSAKKAMFKIVALDKCLDKPIYAGGVINRRNEQADD